MGKTINLITWGGKGDALLAVPAIRALKQKHPTKKLRLFALKRHLDIFINNPHIDILKEASFRNSPVEWILFYLKLIDIQSLDYSPNPIRYHSKSIIEIIGDLLNVDIKDKTMSLFLTEAEQKRGADRLLSIPNAITFNPNGLFTKNKEWFIENWEELIRQMPSYTFVQLGLLTDELIAGGVDMRGLSVRESASIMQASLAYVGVDSFLSHVAVAVATPGVILFGPGSPVIFGHACNINITKNLACSPCIEVLLNSKCPYNKECLREISVNEVKEAILKQLQSSNLEQALVSEIDEQF